MKGAKVYFPSHFLSFESTSQCLSLSWLVMIRLTFRTLTSYGCTSKLVTFKIHDGKSCVGIQNVVTYQVHMESTNKPVSCLISWRRLWLHNIISLNRDCYTHHFWGMRPRINQYSIVMMDGICTRSRPIQFWWTMRIARAIRSAVMVLFRRIVEDEQGRHLSGKLVIHKYFVMKIEYDRIPYMWI